MLSSSYKTTTKWTLSPAVCKVHECSVSHDTRSIPPQLEVYSSSPYDQIINMKPTKPMRPTGDGRRTNSKVDPLPPLLQNKRQRKHWMWSWSSFFKVLKKEIWTSTTTWQLGKLHLQMKTVRYDQKPLRNSSREIIFPPTSITFMKGYLLLTVLLVGSRDC